ncbi:NUDIX hydrolase [Streptomyces malaysiensis]
MTDQPTTEQPGISAAIIVHEDRVLMVRRRVKEGELMWQFPAGAIEDGETAEQAAVRETEEETGLIVEAIKLIGERVHPKTGRLMSYTACSPLEGEAHVADEDELDAVAWVTHGEIPEYVPYGLYERVQEYLDEVIGLPEGEGEADHAGN